MPDHTAGRLARIACLGLAAYSAWAQTAQYDGSGTCKTCHAGVYRRWQKTRIANIVMDPQQHPEAIIPDLSKPDPLVTFTENDIALTHGSK